MVKSNPDSPVSVSTGQPIEQPMGDHARRIVELEHQLALERERSSGLERLAQQAQAHADGLQMALRMIEGTRGERPSEQALSVPSDHAPDVAVSDPEPSPASGPVRPSPGRARRLLAFVRGH